MLGSSRSGEAQAAWHRLPGKLEQQGRGKADRAGPQVAAGMVAAAPSSLAGHVSSATALTAGPSLSDDEQSSGSTQLVQMNRLKLTTNPPLVLTLDSRVLPAAAAAPRSRCSCSTRGASSSLAVSCTHVGESRVRECGGMDGHYKLKRLHPVLPGRCGGQCSSKHYPTRGCHRSNTHRRKKETGRQKDKQANEHTD